jgi:hypothetical protein
MSIPRQTLEKWQTIWQQVCEMAYYKKNIVQQLQIPIDDYDSLITYKNIHRDQFDELMLDFTWKRFSQNRDANGNFIEAMVVPELTFIYVPRILFETIGVYSWFKFSFPNCVICFWEDDMKHYKDNGDV